MLLRQRARWGEMTAVLIFVFGVVLLLTMSGVFHLLTPGTTGRAVLKRLDHASIFILIAATFTPVHFIQFRGLLRWGVLAFIWCAAITGITLKSIYFNDFPEWVSLSLYLGLGWVGALSGYFLYRRFGLAHIQLILWGALAYSVGAVMEFLRFPVLVPNVIGPHELFHIMVLIGIASHWIHIHRLALSLGNPAAEIARKTRIATADTRLRGKFRIASGTVGGVPL